MTVLWPLGIALEIVSTMSGTVGKQCIRLSELTRKSRPGCSRIFFFAGMVVNTALGPLIDMGAYSFAAQSLIAPFGGLDVVWNAALAPFILKETLTAGRAAGCGLIVAGTALAGIFGNHDEPEYTVEYIEETLINMRVLFYFVGFAGWFLLNRCWLMRFPPGSAIRGVSLGCTAGTIAGNMFCCKAAMELVQRSIVDRDGGIWLSWLPYVLLAGGFFFAVANVGYMTQGLQEYEALFMVTIYEGSMIVSGCLSGAVVLLDVQSLAYWHIILYAFGVLIVVAGMWVIFSQEVKQKSSLLQGQASITDLARQESQKLPRLLRQRSNFAACMVEILDRVHRRDQRRVLRVNSAPSFSRPDGVSDVDEEEPAARFAPSGATPRRLGRFASEPTQARSVALEVWPGSSPRKSDIPRTPEFGTARQAEAVEEPEACGAEAMRPPAPAGPFLLSSPSETSTLVL